MSQEELDGWQRDGDVELWGHPTDMSVVLSQATVVVLPSYRDGSPKVLSEAAACGRAVITTDTPGCRDAIDPGVTDLLVPAKNSQALAQAIGTLLDDRERCAVMGQAGRRLAEKIFDVKSIIRQHLEIYATLMKNLRR